MTTAERPVSGRGAGRDAIDRNSIDHNSIDHNPIDKDALRAKYLEERDKRLRADGADQYIEVTGRFARYVDDPYTERVEREPVTDEVTVAVVGGGFAGLVTGARLVQAGVTDVRVVEKGGDFGGTWYWNRYPGAQCDTHSFVYLPLLEETGHMPTEKYARAPEIAEHCRRIGRHFGLYDRALLGTEVTELTWDDDAARWTVRTNRGDEFRARFVTMGTGPLHRPKLPGIPGIETFAGHSFHTSRWDYDYTGGDPAGAPLDRLADKRVAIIGTGATAVQAVPHLATACERLYVFQRTPSAVDVRSNEPTDPDWFAGIATPGWQDRWLMNFTMMQTGGFAEQDLVMDGWTEMARRMRERIVEDGITDFSPASLGRLFRDMGYEKMEEIRARVDDIVADEHTADGLKPWYHQGCKRPCFHDEYLHAFNEPGVTLVHTDGRGVDRITESAVVFDGVSYEVDCIIYASGFETSTDYVRRSGFDMVGRDGVTLSERWAEGMRTLHGIHTHGFPNAFVVGAVQGANLVSNFPHNLSEAGRTVAAVIAATLEGGYRTVEVTEEAEDAWVELLIGSPGRRFAGTGECTPGYYNNEGQSAGLRGKLNSIGYPPGPVAFFQLMEAWRADGSFEGLELRP